MKKTIITVATTGAWPKKKDNPNVPMTPAEIAGDVYACWKAGAAMAHLHMRDDAGNGTMDKNKFRQTVELLRTPTRRAWTRSTGASPTNLAFRTPASPTRPVRPTWRSCAPRWAPTTAAP